MQWHNPEISRIFLLLFLSIISACERVSVEPDTASAGYDYYPLAEGDYRIYQVYRINYNFVSENDTLQFQLKEVITDRFLNQQGDTTYVLQRLRRQEQNTPWQLDSVYHIRRTAYQAVEWSDNRPVVKLVFPLQEGKAWNSNALHAAEIDSFKMVEVHKPFQLPDSLYEKTLTVLQRNMQDNIVQEDVRKEVYASGVGPVYRLVKTLNYCAKSECIGQGIINTGVFEEMKLQRYGREE